MKALGFGVALMLVATVVSAQDQRPPTPEPEAVSYRFAVVSYDVVSGPAREPR